MLSKKIPARTVRWVNPDSTHLTLKFLGDVPRSQLESIENAVRVAVEPCARFALRAEALGCFPNTKHPKVVWVGLQGERAKLSELRDRVEAQVSPLGYPTEDRPFHPHLTLGRVKSTDSRDTRPIGTAVEANPIGEIAQWNCQSVVVMQSTLTPAGAVYTPLAEFHLKA